MGRKKWPYGNGNTWPINGGKNRPSQLEARCTDRLFGDHRVSCSSTVCGEMFHSFTRMGISCAEHLSGDNQVVIHHVTVLSFLTEFQVMQLLKLKKYQQMGITIWGETSEMVLS